MVSIHQSDKDIDSELPELQERYKFDSDDEEDITGKLKINISQCGDNNQINTIYMYDKEFLPLPTINNKFPTHINTNSPISSVSSITIEKIKNKVFNKVDDFFKKQKQS